MTEGNKGLLGPIPRKAASWYTRCSWAKAFLAIPQPPPGTSRCIYDSKSVELLRADSTDHKVFAGFSLHGERDNITEISATGLLLLENLICLSVH